MQRPQIVRPRLVFVGLGPVGPRHLADIKVAAAVHRKAMRGQEFGWTKTGAEAAQPRNAFSRIVDDGHAGTEIGHVAVDRLRRAEFADVADRALAGRHEQAAGAVQVVPCVSYLPLPSNTCTR